MSDLAIVVPSRRRPQNIQRILALLPKANICIDETELDAYASVTPKGQLTPHPPLQTMGAIRQWILDHYPHRGLCMIDDDFSAVYCLVGHKKRKITDPAAILAIITNTAQVTEDLGLGLFSWGRQPNPMHFKPYRPIGLCGFASNAWGVVGRTRRMDQSLVSAEDVDYTLQHLLHQRITYQDRRFYFDCGNVFSGPGGLQGIRTAETLAADTAALKAKWGAHVSAARRTATGVLGVSIRVKRSARLAQKDPAPNTGYKRNHNGAVHRTIMEQAIGRPLRGDEQIHHIDRNKANNRLENLVLCADRTAHMRFHGKANDNATPDEVIQRVRPIRMRLGPSEVHTQGFGGGGDVVGS